MSEDESVSEYNERVLEIANESLLLGEKIPESKIVHKMLRSLLEKFDMKVTAIEEAHDITKLKLDELFMSLLSFEITISNRENKKGKSVAFKSVYEEESTVNKSESKANVNDSIALLTKQFSKIVKKFKNMNLIGSNSRNPTNYRRRDGESYNRWNNKSSNRRDGDYVRKRDGEGIMFKCQECGRVCHYQAEYPTFLRKQKKNFRATLSNEDTNDSEEDDGGTNAFIVNLTEADFVTEDENEDFDEESDNELSFK
ncbi:Receptor-like protein 12 [Cucumis melo var. makuwa]|uniref:Receptor-like protein 12 n=1 Tax=Cucumis melo var. makuwa TaxID=1194695 RepID=A0A5A7U3Y3_CUCMM|nr:Receptor-like protein 12 [Cucumis melo var. makuwa]